MKKTARLGSYIAEKEPAHLKVTHESGTFNFRLKGGVEIDQFFEEIKKEDSKKYFEVGFASVNVFTILMMQNPTYLMAWIAFHNDYFEKLKSPEVTDEKDAEICAEEEALYGLEHISDEEKERSEGSDISLLTEGASGKIKVELLNSDQSVEMKIKKEE